MASTSAAAIQLRTYPAFPAAPHKGGGEPVLFIAFFLRNPRGRGLPSEEAYLHGPVTNAQQLTPKAHVSDPRWRESRPSRPYGGEPEVRTPRREPRGSGPVRPTGLGSDAAATRKTPARTDLTQSIAPQPTEARAGRRSRRAAKGARRSRGRGAAGGSGGRGAVGGSGGRGAGGRG